VYITMTTFVDFVLKSGTPQLTCVRRAKRDYERGSAPERDFYKVLRDAIPQVHQEQKARDSLDGVLGGLKDPKKADAYAQCISGYKQWWSKKQIKWVDIHPWDWTEGDLTVRVNPELGVMVDGHPQVIKLYFKADAASKRRIETMFHLLRLSLPEELAGATPGILDVRRSNLFTPTTDIPDIEALLRGQAAGFATMWKQLAPGK